jgi:hypothetical protein
LTAAISGSADIHIKERLSLIELGFRLKEKQIAAMNSSPLNTADKLAASLSRSSLRVPGDPNSGEVARRKSRTGLFSSNVEELNTRFRQNNYPLNYHNGYIQFSMDDLVQTEVEEPFWRLVADPVWTNVDLEMKNALDLRDTDGQDPAFYAVRALESTIKIISGEKGWTHGGEKGAHNYIDNLVSKKNGFIYSWEGAALKDFFTHVRNPFGHGAGNSKMPRLMDPQTDWAIEFCMIWIKNLIQRM